MVKTLGFSQTKLLSSHPVGGSKLSGGSSLAFVTINLFCTFDWKKKISLLVITILDCKFQIFKERKNIFEAK